MPELALVGGQRGEAFLWGSLVQLPVGMSVCPHPPPTFGFKPLGPLGCPVFPVLVRLGCPYERGGEFSLEFLRPGPKLQGTL